MAEPAVKRAKTERVFLFSSESVNEGHPDKLCDQVSDAFLDALLVDDPAGKVISDTANSDNMVMAAGEFASQTKIDYDIVVFGVMMKAVLIFEVITEKYGLEEAAVRLLFLDADIEPRTQ
mmetsp:Transcript_67300/g.190793  ORF Transcript_67300/g.190793 Transcript_67300/m.190793 type:complete len:120 (+) Transcript_67300:94-453(+)